MSKVYIYYVKTLYYAVGYLFSTSIQSLKEVLLYRKCLRVITESVDLVTDYGTDLIFYLSVVIPVNIIIPLCRQWFSNYLK